MSIKIYGVPASVAVKRVLVVCEEKKIPFEFVNVDIFKGEHRTPEYAKEQPFGLIPYIVDDGFQLYESRAIARYLVSKFPSEGAQLIPAEAKANALFEQAASIELCNFDPYAAGFSREKLFKKVLTGVDGSEERAAEYKDTLEKKLQVYDLILSKQKYLAGNEVTLADLFHLPWLDVVISLGFDGLENKPNVTRWWKDISSRPSWKAVKATA